MKKVIFAVAVLMFASVSVSAAELGLTVGRDQKFGKDYTAISAGTDVVGLKLGASFQTVRDQYVAFGGSVGKSVGMDAFSVTPSVGMSIVNPTVGKNGVVATAGIQSAYALTKQASVVVDLTRRFDVKDAAAFRGNLIGAGLKVSF